MTTLDDWLTRPGAVAARLRALRRRRGLTGVQLAAALGWAQSKVSRIETGRQVPTEADLDAWAEATEAAGAERTDLRRLREDAVIQHLTFARRTAAGQAPVQGDYNRLYERSTLVRHLDSVWVPGLLQIPAYTRVLLAEVAELAGTAVVDVDQAVAVRAQRQALLYGDGRRFEFLLSEAVLRYRLAPPPVLRAQFDRLLAAATLPTVRFGIIPFGVPLRWSPGGTLQIFHTDDDTMAVVEDPVGETPHRGERAAAYDRMVDRLWDDAATGDAARRIILNAIDALPPGDDA